MPKRKCSNIDASVGLRMRYYRIQCGLTQQQVADALGIRQQSVTDALRAALKRMRKLF